MDSSGMFMNSSAEMYPLWPRSRALKRLYSASISSCENLPLPAGNQSGIRACKAILQHGWHQHLLSLKVIMAKHSAHRSR